MQNKPSSKAYKEAIEVVNAWRVCHAYPINTFKSTLWRKVKNYDSPIVAQRLKRLPTIIDKLNRYPHMELARMNDIGGVRGIVDTVKQVRELQEQYQDEKRFSHRLVRKDDYITNPKDDGYRGVHLIYRYHNTRARTPLAKQYEGLLIELQLRTKLQHNWATAVETMGTFRGEALKSRQGSADWLEFFTVTSAAFAHIEKTPLAAKYSSLTATQTFKKMAIIEKKLGVLETIRGYSIAAGAIHRHGFGASYHLIILNTKDHTVQINSYKTDQLALAGKDYAEAEKKATKDKALEPVLVSAGRLKSLKKAYPNYFLDVREFVEKIEVILKELDKK